MKPEPLLNDGAAQELIRFCQTLSVDAVPGSVINNAKWCLLDSLSCALFGSRQPWARIMAEEMIAEGSKGHSSIMGRAEMLAAPAAALCNGTATHGFELDDLLDEAIVHPGAIVVPAALAAAEAVEAPGSRLLLGVIAGYEAINRVGLAIGVEPARRGHHQTALAGPLGSVIGAGMLPLGTAMETTGTARYIADLVLGGLGKFGPVATLGGIYLLAALVTQPMSNAASIVLTVPIAIDTAMGLGANHLTFTLAVVIGAATSFLTPVGHKANVLVFGPGGYKFFDYARVGALLTVFLFIATMIALPIFFPLFP